MIYKKIKVGGSGPHTAMAWLERRLPHFRPLVQGEFSALSLFCDFRPDSSMKVLGHIRRAHGVASLSPTQVA